MPFGDLDFVKYVMSVDPAKEDEHLRQGQISAAPAPLKATICPHDILFREKAAFSDAVGHSMVDYLKEYAESCYTDAEFEEKRMAYTHARPFTKESSALPRAVSKNIIPIRVDMIRGFWMPNKAWENCDVNDPSRPAC